MNFLNYSVFKQKNQGYSDFCCCFCFWVRVSLWVYSLRLEYSGTNSAHCSLNLPESSDPPASGSSVAGLCTTTPGYSTYIQHAPESYYKCHSYIPIPDITAEWTSLCRLEQWRISWSRLIPLHNLHLLQTTTKDCPHFSKLLQLYTPLI